MPHRLNVWVRPFFFQGEMSGLHLHYIYNWLKFGYLLKFDGKCLRKINSIPKTHFTFAPNNMQADEF